MQQKPFLSALPIDGSSRLFLGALILILIGWGSWVSVPRHKDRFDAGQLRLDRRIAGHALCSLPLDATRSQFTIQTTGLRIAPGGVISIARTAIDGPIRGHFQAVSANGTEIAILAERKGGRDLLLRRRLDPATTPSDGAPFYFLIETESLPPDTEHLVLTVPPDAAGSVDCRDLAIASTAERAALPDFPLHWIAFDSFAMPTADRGGVYCHAPAQVILLLPPGRFVLHGSFGFNSAVFVNPANHSDGADFQVSVDSIRGGAPLFERHISPDSNPAERSLQSFSIPLAVSAATRLRLSTGPGPRDNISFDWLVWRDLRLDLTSP